jgi:8-oxo-dGTP diphosphatase
MAIDRFNIRIYGLLIDEGKILLTDEFRLGMLMTKFPGGWLQFGEGPVDCVIREFMEELQTEITVKSHFYTTENFFSTNLLPFESQLINIYYRVEAKKPFRFKTTEKKYDFPEMKDGAQCFRWMKISGLPEDAFTFPIDRLVLNKLKKEDLQE